MIEQQLKATIRDIPDFPKPGIVFKDITPVFKHPALCLGIVDAFVERLRDCTFDAVVGIDSRGFLFGPMLAVRLGIPFIPIRKKGKLPGKTISESYALEYGAATIEMHDDAFGPGTKVLIHDDLLATGGTVAASSRLVERLGGEVVAYAFIVALDFLNGRQVLDVAPSRIVALASYD